MSFWRRNHLPSRISSTATSKVVMVLFLIFLVMQPDLGQAVRPMFAGGGTNPKYGGEKAVSFRDSDHVPVTPSEPNPCTYIPIRGKEPCHPH